MMAKSHNIHLNLSVFIAFISLIFVAKLSATLGKTARNKVVLPLIHRDSVLSPFYNPMLHVTSSADDSSLAQDDIRSRLIPADADPSSFGFLINISIGEPPVPQLLFMDTGSPLTWVCTSCAGSPLSGHLYDPTKSSTYDELPCDRTSHEIDQYCSQYADYSHCGEGSQCAFYMEYADGTHTKGILGREKFIFETSSDGLMEVSDVVFGSAVDLSGNAAINTKIQGILGLGPTNGMNLMDRFSNQFSYCIGNISDKSYQFNQLILGDGAILEGSSTELLTGGDHYFVRLEGISVGENQLNITFGELDHNLMVDSGTTYTQLRRSVFDPLKKEVEILMKSLVPSAGSSGERLCYKGNLERDLKGFPTVTFHFSGETDLDLDVEAMFRRGNDDLFCMAVDVYESPYSILGIYAQQYYNIGFDLENNQISFQRIDCELLEG